MWTSWTGSWVVSEKGKARAKRSASKTKKVEGPPSGPRPFAASLRVGRTDRCRPSGSISNGIRDPPSRGEPPVLKLRFCSGFVQLFDAGARTPPWGFVLFFGCSGSAPRCRDSPGDVLSGPRCAFGPRNGPGALRRSSLSSFFERFVNFSVYWGVCVVLKNLGIVWKRTPTENRPRVAAAG